MSISVVLGAGRVEIWLTLPLLQLGNRLLVGSSNGNLRFGILATTVAFQGNWRKSLSLMPRLRTISS